MSTRSPSGGNSSDAGGAAQKAPEQPGSSKVLRGRYEILDSIAETERSFVFRGKLLPEGDDLAIKILKERYAQDPQFLERYAAELRATAALPAHASLLRYHEIDTIARRFCVVSEYFPAPPLEGAVSATVVMPYPAVLSAMQQLTSLLALGFKEGMLQRAIRLEDVLFRPDDRRLKLQRFGASRAGASGASAASRKPMGPGSDLLFLGVTLFLLLTGRRHQLGRDEVAEVTADQLVEELKLRYPELSGPEIAGLSKLYVASTTREMAKRLDSYEGFESALTELEKTSLAIQDERRRAERDRVREEERDSYGSAFDTVALLTGHGRSGSEEDRGALRELSRPLEGNKPTADELDAEPGGPFSIANVAIVVCALALLAFVYWLFYR